MCPDSSAAVDVAVLDASIAGVFFLCGLVFLLVCAGCGQLLLEVITLRRLDLLLLFLLER